MQQELNEKEKIDAIRDKVQKLIDIVNELEHDFPGRRFTLDGHLIGSIGEVMAAYYYDIDLAKPSNKLHDGTVEIQGAKHEVQIKITQQNNIMICGEPDYLLVLYLTKTGDVYEVYNGPGEEPWLGASPKDNLIKRHMRVNKLMKMDTEVDPYKRIKMADGRVIEKMREEYKNKPNRRTYER